MACRFIILEIRKCFPFYFTHPCHFLVSFKSLTKQLYPMSLKPIIPCPCLLKVLREGENRMQLKGSFSMAKHQPISVSEAVHKTQLHLLDGIRDEKQLISSGSLISQIDCEDVVTERSIPNICSYPLCRNPLPSEPRRRGRHPISLKEHRVYDLQETNRFCSAHCLINSRAFAGSLRRRGVPF